MILTLPYIRSVPVTLRNKELSWVLLGVDGQPLWLVFSRTMSRITTTLWPWETHPCLGTRRYVSFRTAWIVAVTDHFESELFWTKGEL